MKVKMSLAAIAMVLSSTTFAQSSMSVNYAVQNDVSPAVQKHVTGLKVQTNLAKNLDGDIGISATTADVANTITNRYEAGLIYSYPVNSTITASVRGAIGTKQASGKEDYAYHSVEPAVSIKLPVNGLSAKVGYRFRDGFETVAKDTNQATRYQLSYALTKADKIAIGHDIQRGDSANKTTSIQYSRSF
jgi:hypothetical protein